MVSFFKKLCVLMWKCVILRKRNCLLTAFELIAPLLVMYHMHSLLVNLKHMIGFHTFTPTSIFDVDELHELVAYSPTNNFTDEIMKNFHHNRSSPTPVTKQDEADLDMWLKNQTLLGGPITQMCVAIFFLIANKTSKIFKYQIQINRQDHDFLNIQFRLDTELLKSTGLKFDGGGRFFGQLPKPSPVNVIYFFMIYLFMILAYSFLVVSVVRDVIQEKASGIKELMKIMGVSTWMIWTHWFIYTLMVHLPLTVGSAFLLAGLSPPAIEANIFIIWLLFFLFTINCIILLFVSTCFFNNPSIGTTICMLGWFIIHFIALRYFPYPHQLGFYSQIFFCLLPLNNLLWTIQSIVSFHTISITWRMSYLFSEGTTGSHISVGLSIIIFILEMLMLTIALLFLDTIKPGPHGVSKPITFIWNWYKQLQNLSSPSQEVSCIRASLPRMFEPPPEEAKVAIEIRGLHKRFGVLNNVVAVENIDLDIYEGEIMALLGHNGAGKTTTMSMITGLFSPTRGIILFDGKNIHSTLSTYRESLGLCTQHNMYFPKLTVIEHLLFFGMLKGMSYSESKANSIELLESLKMIHKKDARVLELPGGMKRRLCLSVSLIGKPKILILDEPTSGLDPESRRQIWNVILSRRGQCTILITTHYMEEADVLGDRIAIMDHGQIVCCGTTMFLKTMYGAGYHIHILKESKSPTYDISYLFQQYVPNPQIRLLSPTQVNVTIKKNYVNKFPSLFAALEKHRKSLGITAITITCSTIEDVFFKVADIPADLDAAEVQSIKSKSLELRLSIADHKKAEGGELRCQQLEALLWKRLIFRRRNIWFFLLKIIITCFLIGLICKSMQVESPNVTDQKLVEISLDRYPGSSNLIIYDDEGTKVADIAINLIRNQKGEITILPNNTNITDYMINLANIDFPKYSQTLLALQFIKGNFTMQYQYQSENDLPAIAANLMANIMLQNSTNDNSGSINVMVHPYTPPQEELCGTSFFLEYFAAYSWMFFCPLTFILLIVDPIPFLTEERASGFKHQQFLTGVAPLIFWVSNFIFDYCIYICIIVIYLTIIIVFGGKVVADSGLIGLLIVVILLYGVSGFFFVYFFTFLTDSAGMSISMFLMGNILFCLLPAFIMKIHSTYNYSIFLLAIGLLSFNPLFAATMSLSHIATAMVDRYMCKYCDDINLCTTVKNNLLTMPSEEDRSGILMYVLFLALSWILYFSIILAIDSGLVRRIYLIFCYKQGGSLKPDDEEEDVIEEINRAKSIKESGVTTPLRVEDLVKKYFRGPVAVNKVSFVVGSGECFGLMGANGAGKTTTFKILTGEITPNRGDAVIFNHSVISNRRKYRTFVGYCPQFDSFLHSLTGEEILKIIVQLRGISRKMIKVEVENWLKMMGISEHARKRSGEYSGGTKRKLSTAMAFIGDPPVVFLDEPTAGLDPVSRRKLWNVLQLRKTAGQAIVLSSHSMEECEALCTRLTIMEDGQMKCIGSTEHLKNKFSQGYIVIVKLIPAKDNELTTFKEEVSNKLPASVIRDENKNMIQYQIPDSNILLSQLFTVMFQMKEKHNIIEDFTVSNTTLEQLFMSFVKTKNVEPNLK